MCFIEEYIFARYYMYQNVYLHKTTRGFEKMIEAMWKRAKKLQSERRGHAPRAGARRFLGDRGIPSERRAQYPLRIEEFTVPLTRFRRGLRIRTKHLPDLSRRFLARDGFAMIDPPRPKDEARLLITSAWDAAADRVGAEEWVR